MWPALDEVGAAGMSTSRGAIVRLRLEEAGARAVAAALNWHSGKDQSGLRLYIDLLRRSALAGSITFTASIKHIADTAGFGFTELNGGSLDASAVRRARKTLRVLGMLHFETREVDPDASWHARTSFTLLAESRLGEDANLARQGLQRLSPYLLPTDVDALGGEKLSVFDLLQHVVWEQKGLGMNGLRVWLCLVVHGPMRASAVRQRLSISEGTTRSRLRQLASEGLASCEAGLWSFRWQALDVIAAGMGLQGRAARRARVRQHLQQSRQRAFGAGPYAGAPRGVQEAPDCPLLARMSAFPCVQVVEDPRKRQVAYPRSVGAKSEYGPSRHPSRLHGGSEVISQVGGMVRARRPTQVHRHEQRLQDPSGQASSETGAVGSSPSWPRRRSAAALALSAVS